MHDQKNLHSALAAAASGRDQQNRGQLPGIVAEEGLVSKFLQILRPNTVALCLQHLRDAEVCRPTAWAGGQKFHAFTPAAEGGKPAHDLSTGFHGYPKDIRQTSQLRTDSLALFLSQNPAAQAETHGQQIQADHRRNKAADAGEGD